MEQILIARAPVRINLGGDGTDSPGYCERWGGLVISATIRYYVYAILASSQLDGVQVIFADHRISPEFFGGQGLARSDNLSLPKSIAHHFNIQSGLDVFLALQVPYDSGFGLSGSVAASMIKALAFRCGLDLGPKEVAELACYIQIEKMGMPVGKQDAYAAAFGGLNSITFSKGDAIVQPLSVSSATRQMLQEGSMLFSLGAAHDSFSALGERQQEASAWDEETIRRLDSVKKLCLRIRQALEAGDLNAFGELLHLSWLEQRQLPGQSANPTLDRGYELARERGALGGRISGTGNGGFLLLYCPRERQQTVAEALAAIGLQRWPLALEDEGVQVMQAVSWPRQQLVQVVPWSQPTPQGSISPYPQGS